MTQTLTQNLSVTLADLIQDAKGHGERLLTRSHGLPDTKRQPAVQNAADILRAAHQADDIYRNPKLDATTRTCEIQALLDQAQKIWRRSQWLFHERAQR